MKALKLLFISAALIATSATMVNGQTKPVVTQGEAKSKVTIAETTPAPTPPLRHKDKIKIGQP
jgi:hypothetical protein